MLRIVLTFDDGFLSHYYVAKVLRARRVKATFFIPTHEYRWTTLARHPRLLAGLIDMGHEVASHGMYHTDLTKLSLSELEFHLRESFKYISDVTGNDAVGLAYPYGVYNTKVAAVASKYYSYACGSALYSWEDPLNVSLLSTYAIGRISVENLSGCLTSIKRLMTRLLSRKRRSDSSFKPTIVLVYHCTKSFLAQLPFLERLEGTFHTLYEAFKDVIDNAR